MSMAERFQNRVDAGRQLAGQLDQYVDEPDVLVLGLPRGGVPVAAEVARTLPAPLDILLVRKLGVPGREELAFGAIATGGARVLNEDVVGFSGISSEEIEPIVRREQAELDRREREYRGNRPSPPIQDHTVILVDDGLATGATMRAAVAATRQLQPTRIVVAVPAGSPEAIRELEREADEVTSIITPDPYYSVGTWYEDFAQVTDDDVRSLLQDSSQRI